jgi:hypothetical protein
MPHPTMIPPEQRERQVLQHVRAGRERLTDGGSSTVMFGAPPRWSASRLELRVQVLQFLLQPATSRHERASATTRLLCEIARSAAGRRSS